MNILVVDDEKEIADLVDILLSGEGYRIYKCYRSIDALKIINDPVVELDMAIIDIMMPGLDGFSLCAKIREKHLYPVIMLTAKIDSEDKVAGLSLGADDYVTKPFVPQELVARVNALLRRYKQYDSREVLSEDAYEIGGLQIDLRKHSCQLYGETVQLTPKEFDILWLLCENQGQVVSSEEIFEKVWKEKYLDSNNTVMVHIRRLREKLHEDSKNPRIIKTVWGVGYKIEKYSA